MLYIFDVTFFEFYNQHHDLHIEWNLIYVSKHDMFIVMFKQQKYNMFRWHNHIAKSRCSIDKRDMFVDMFENINIKINRKQTMFDIKQFRLFNKTRCMFQKVQLLTISHQIMMRTKFNSIKIYFDKIFVFQNWFWFCVK